MVKTIANNQKAPKAEFWPEYSALEQGDSVKFINVSMYDPISYVWNFENGIPSTSTQVNPTTRYNIPGSHRVTLTATNQYGVHQLVKDTLIKVKGLTSLSENDISKSKELTISVFPNPFTNKISVKIHNAQYGNFDLKVSNSVGQLILNKVVSYAAHTPIEIIDLSNSPSGVYFLGITSQRTNKVHRIIKQ